MGEIGYCASAIDKNLCSLYNINKLLINVDLLQGWFLGRKRKGA
jgi:hypothetical protein